MDPIDIQRVEEVVGHQFRDHQLLKTGLTHASLVDSRLQSNERLEFLGDSVLGLVVCDYLFTHYPDLLEGEMTKIKSMVVSRRVCAEVAAELGLEEVLRLGKGMSRRSALPGSVLAAVLESLIGAVYLDGGLEVAREFILRMMRRRIEQAARSGHQHNFKSVLQQTAQQTMGMTPQYVVLDEKGPDHAKCFEVAVEIGARRFGSCWGPSKKQAEQDAALQALRELGLATNEENGEISIQRSPGEDASESDDAQSEGEPIEHASTRA
jgi:ribonuclease III